MLFRSWEGSQLNRAKEILAFELTSMVHGEEEARKAEASAKALFTGSDSANAPTTELSEADLIDGTVDIMTLLVKTGLCAAFYSIRSSGDPGAAFTASGPPGTSAPLPRCPASCPPASREYTALSSQSG